MIPLIFMGDGEFRASSPYHVKRCAELYGQGEVVEVEEINDRSKASHKHYFAQLTDYWQTLPESLAQDFLSMDHLRKFCLIKAGYCTQHILRFRSKEEALEAESFISELDPYVLCEVIGTQLTVWRAKSQSMQAMKKDEFEKSKADTLDIAHKLVGDRRDL